jgi:hypothetical protein
VAVTRRAAILRPQWLRCTDRWSRDGARWRTPLAGAAGVAAARRPRAEQWRRRGGICQCTCHGHVGAARTPLASDCLGLLSDTVSMAMDNALPGPRARPGRRRHTVHVRLASNLMGWPLGYRVGEYFLTGHRTGLQPNGHFYQ